MTQKQKYHLHDGASGAAIAVRVTANAPRTQIVSIGKDGSVEIQLDCQANGKDENQTLIAYLAGVLKIPAAKIEIVAGQASAQKLIAVLSLDSAVVSERIASQIKG